MNARMPDFDEGDHTAELARVREENAELRKALEEAIRYVESMRVVQGGIRDQMRRRWRLLLGKAAN